MARLCKAGQQLREQIDDAFPNRDRASDGWKASPGHKAHSPKSDHNPNEGVVYAIDVDADLKSDKSAAFDLANQLRLLARRDKRISYIIFNGRIASWVGNYRWRKYRGINPHKTHIHISFTKLGKDDGGMFYLPILTGDEDGTTISNPRKLGKKLLGSGNSDIPGSGLGCKCNCECSSGRESARYPSLS